MKEILELAEDTAADTCFKDDAAKIPDFKIPSQNDTEWEIKNDAPIEDKQLDSTDSAIIPDFRSLVEISPFSNIINSFIKTFDEIKVYLDSGLEESVVNGKPVLKDTSINPDLVDSNGRTNLERMKTGLAPLDEKGEPYNLHHVGQKSNSPLAELKNGTHKENDSVLHDPSIKDSNINRTEFARERAEHWKARSEEIEAKIKEGE